MSKGESYDEIRCPDKWYDVISLLCEQIDRYVKRMQNVSRSNPCKSLIPSRSFEDIEIFQIKEKFGELRVYTNRTDSFVDGLITMSQSVVRNIT